MKENDKKVCGPGLKERLKSFVTSRSTWTFVGCVAIIVVLAFAYFYPDAVQGNVLRQHDTQQGIANGQEAVAFKAATGETTRWTNSLFSGMPTFQIAPSYPSNDLFTWLNDVMGLGLPSPSNLLAMMMLGFFILLVVMRVRMGLALIGAIAYGFSTYFIILIGAGHIWKFVTLAYIPPTIAGIVLAYRGRYLAGAAMAALFAMLQIASNHVQMTYYFLFVIVGFVVAYLAVSIKRREMKRWSIATGSLAVAAVLAVAANLPSLYNTKEYSKETMRGGHSELTQPAAQGDAVTTDGLARDYITQYSYQPSETFTLLIPNVKGGASIKPEKGENKLMSLASMDEAQQLSAEGRVDQASSVYLENMTQYFGDPEMTNGPVYVGAIIFVFFLIGCFIVKGPMKWMLLVLTVFSILLAWGRHFMGLTDLMIDYMPMYSKFRTVESILVIAEFTMPLLAVLAIERLVSSKDAWAEYRKPVIWCFVATMAVCLLGVISPGIFGSLIGEGDRNLEQAVFNMLKSQGMDSPEAIQMFSLQNPTVFSTVETLRGQLVSSDALRSLCFIAAAAILLYFYMRRKVSTLVTVAGVGVLVVADLYLVNKRYVDHESFVVKTLQVGAPIAKLPADDVILRDTAMNYRVMDIPRFNSADPSYYHKMLGGYHAAKLTRYQDLIDRHLSNFLRAEEDSADWNVINMLNARYIVDMEGNAVRNPEAMGNAWMVDEVKYVKGAAAEMDALASILPATTAVADTRFEPALGRSAAKTPGDTIFETSYAPNRLTYHSRSAKGGVAVFSEVYFPWGWTATIDGNPAEIGRVNYVLRALRLPAGEHTIVMTFDPPSLHNTVTVARVAIVVIYLLVIAAIVAAFACRRCPAKAEEGEPGK